MSTPGKGPFASQQKATPVAEYLHWDVPLVDLTEENVHALLSFIKAENAKQTLEFVTGLVNMSPEHRLSRNMVSLMRCLAEHHVYSALRDGLLKSESVHLRTLEELGITVTLLGVVHRLLDIQERNVAAELLNGVFHARRTARRPW